MPPKTKTKPTKVREVQLKHWCFTVNNPTVPLDSFMDLFKDLVTYMVVGEEVGESGTPHYQGYIELKTKTRFSALKKLFPPPLPHLEHKCKKSTRYQAADYCRKEGKFAEIGIPPRVGSSKAQHLDIMCDAIKNGQTLEQAAQLKPAAFVQNHNGLAKWRDMCTTIPNRRDMECHLYYGATNTGKTHKAFTDYPELFKKPIGKGLWFDGYNAEKQILIDEFHGQYPLSDILQIMDVWKCKVEIKCNHTYLQNNLLIFTSNMHPSQFQYWEGNKREELKSAFNRRFTKIVWFITRSDIRVFDKKHDILRFLDDIPDPKTFKKLPITITSLSDDRLNPDPEPETQWPDTAEMNQDIWE